MLAEARAGGSISAETFGAKASRPFASGVYGQGNARSELLFTRHTSHVTRNTSYVTCQTSHVTRHTSHVTRHTSHVTHHTSHVTRCQAKDYLGLRRNMAYRHVIFNHLGLLSLLFAAKSTTKTKCMNTNIKTITNLFTAKRVLFTRLSPSCSAVLVTVPNFPFARESQFHSRRSNRCCSAPAAQACLDRFVQATFPAAGPLWC